MNVQTYGLSNERYRSFPAHYPPHFFVRRPGFMAWGVPPNSSLFYTLECVAIDKGPMPTAPTTRLRSPLFLLVIGVMLMAAFFMSPRGHKYLLYAESHVQQTVMWIVLLATPGGVCVWWVQMVIEHRRFRRQLKDR